MENGRTKAQVFEKSKKQAMTDGIKRTLRSFGNLLGNCVYDAEYLKKIHTVKGPQVVCTAAQLGTVRKLMKAV